jgi:replicative DNA helicase
MASAPTAHVPPQNIEAEESVLGAMLVAESTLTRVIDEVKLNAGDFYLDKHAAIFTCIHDLYAASKPVDELSVSEALVQHNQIEQAGGKHYVSELAAKVPAAGNAKHYAEIVQQNSLLRRLLGAGQQIQGWVHERDGEPRELSERAEKLLFDVAHKEQASDFKLLSEILHDEVDRLEKLSTGELELTGTPSGFRDIDAITGGFQPGNLIIVAARPAMGKSAIVANIAENVAVKRNLPVAFFSLEMSEVELAQRFIACRARISGDKLRKGQVAQKDWPKVVRACNELEEAPLWFDDSSDLGLLDLRAKARRLHAQEQDRGGLGLVIVDYLQLMRADDARANRVEQVGQMSRGLKILARELEVPVLAISQLSRAPEQRHPPKPMLSDLRESGCLTGDSLVYLPREGIHRPIRDLAGQRNFEVLAMDRETWRLRPALATHAFSTGCKQTFRLTTRLGRTVRATANHKFLTIRGWQRLDELSKGDPIAAPGALPGPQFASMQEDELALGADKQRSASAILDYFDGRTRNPNRDVIPKEAWRDLVVPAMERRGMTSRQMQAAIDTKYCGTALYKSGISKERAMRVGAAVRCEELVDLALGDAYWDPIASIEPDGVEEVFDITVDGLHNFVADNIVVHNSIEQDADVVAFLFREDYYRDPDDEPDGLADLIIAKHRNGPIGAPKLVFLDRFPKFADFAGQERPIEQPAGEGPPMEDAAATGPEF